MVGALSTWNNKSLEQRSMYEIPQYGSIRENKLTKKQ